MFSGYTPPRKAPGPASARMRPQSFETSSHSSCRLRFNISSPRILPGSNFISVIFFLLSGICRSLNSWYHRLDAPSMAAKNLDYFSILSAIFVIWSA